MSCTQLRAAIIDDDKTSLAHLLQMPGLNVNDSIDCLGSALSYACRYGQKACVALLLTAPTININLPDTEGDTPLSDALALQWLTCAALLLARPEIDINHANNEGKTALWRAADGNNPQSIRLLLARPELQHVHRRCASSVRHYAYTSALEIANKRGYSECAALLWPPFFWSPRACFPLFYAKHQQQVGLGWQITWRRPPLWRQLPIELITLLLSHLAWL